MREFASSLFGLLAILTVLGSAAVAEIEACNSDRVKSTILSAVEKVKAAALERLKSSAVAQTTIPQWSATIINVRQLEYDDKNNARQCAADVEYHNFPPQEVLYAMALVVREENKATCGRSMRYKIEPLLDKPGQFYVSWKCLN